MSNFQTDLFKLHAMNEMIGGGTTVNIGVDKKRRDCLFRFGYHLLQWQAVESTRRNPRHESHQDCHLRPRHRRHQRQDEDIRPPSRSSLIPHRR